MPIFVTCRLITRKPLTDLWQRFGVFTPPHPWNHPQRLWFHAASVGEVQAAKALITTLRQRDTRADIIVSTVTAQGYLAATKQLAGVALCLYAPIDLPWVVERFINKLTPSVYICLETELWPNTLRLMRDHGITTLLLNGRLSENAFRRYSKISDFMRQVVRCFNAASVIQRLDRERYLALGLEPEKIQVHGNAKYDQHLTPIVSLPSGQQETRGNEHRASVITHYQCLLGLKPHQRVFIAGSTHSGEEALILEAFRTLATAIPDLVLIVAPRHLERLDKIMTDWRGQGIHFCLLSAMTGSRHEKPIILVDQMGELANLYSIATYVFCGGSLVDRGGHNIMEPAFWGKPPLFGPHMSDFNDARSMLEGQDAGFLVQNTQELVARILYFHHHHDSYQQAGQRAATIALAQQGSATRQADIICHALDKRPHNSTL